MRFPYPQRWHSTNRRVRYRMRLIRRVANLLVLLFLFTAAISVWVRSAAQTPMRGVHWGEVPAPASLAARPAVPNLPYTIRADPPWLKSAPSPRKAPVSASAPYLLATPAGPSVPLRRGPAPAKDVPQPVSSPAVPAPDRAGPPAPNPEAAIQGWVESLLPGVLESTVPAFMQVILQRLDRYLELSGQKQLHKRFTEQEFKTLVVQYVQPKSRGQLSDMDAQIRADGMRISGMVNLGDFKLILSARFGVRVVEERPHILFREIRVGSFVVSGGTLLALEKQMNRLIDSQPASLAVREFRLSDGSIWLSVERQVQAAGWNVLKRDTP